MDLEPNDLLLFARVVDDGSLSRAAEHLGLPKSTVSRRLAALEARLGERLLLRTTRRLNLTEFGQAVLEHAHQVAAEVAATSALALHRQARPSGKLRLSVPGDFAQALLAEAFVEFSLRYPEVTLELDLSPRRVDLLSENFDLAIRMGELPDDSTLTARPLGAFTAALYAAPSYLALHGRPRQPEELLRHSTLALARRGGGSHPWLLRHGEQFWDSSARPADPAAPPFAPRLAANSPAFLLQLAAGGMGIAAADSRFAAPYLADGRLEAVLPGWQLPVVQGWIVFPGRRLLSAKSRAFIDFLCAWLQPNNPHDINPPA